MFLSIKWKVLVLLFVILSGLSALWLVLSINKDLANLQQDFTQKTERQNLILQQLLKDEYLKLSQYSHLIVNTPLIAQQNPSQSNTNIQQYLDDNAFNWGLNLSMDFLAIVNANQQIIAEVNQLPKQQHIELKKALYSSLPSAYSSPQNLVFCDSVCIQLVMEPFLFKNGQLGVVIYGQNMSQLVSRYAFLSGSDLAILLPHRINSVDTVDGLDINEKQTLDLGIKGKWNLWAMSNYAKLLPVLEKYESVGENTRLDLFTLFDTPFFYKQLMTNQRDHIGKPVIYLSMFTEEQRIALFRKEVINSFQTALLLFVITFIIFILLFLGPLRKIKKLATIYQELPQAGYQKAGPLVSKSSGFFKDELSELEMQTTKLVHELKEMDNENAISKQKLVDKVKLLTSSQDYLQNLFDQSNLCIAMLNSNLTVANTNRHFSNLLHKNAINTLFLDYLSSEVEKQKVQKMLFDIKQGVNKEAQLLTSIKVSDDEVVKVFWSFAVTIDNQGLDKILTIGMPISIADSVSYFEDRRVIKKTRKEDLMAFNDPKFIADHKSEILQCLTKCIEKTAFQLLYQPRFAINHLVINEYQVVLKFRQTDCQALSYDTIRQNLSQDIDILAIDKWGLQSVYEFIERDKAAHQNLKVCFPISKQSLLSSDFLNSVAYSHDEPEIDMPNVHFEIDYTPQLLSEPAIKEAMLNLHKAGHEITLALFSSSIDNWLDMELIGIENIKVSACLFEELKASGELTSRLQKIVSSAHNIGVAVIVDGVSDENDYLVLQKVGVDWVQGSFIKEPQSSLLNSLDIVTLQAMLKNL